MNSPTKIFMSLILLIFATTGAFAADADSETVTAATVIDQIRNQLAQPPDVKLRMALENLSAIEPAERSKILNTAELNAAAFAREIQSRESKLLRLNIEAEILIPASEIFYYTFASVAGTSGIWSALFVPAHIFNSKESWKPKDLRNRKIAYRTFFTSAALFAISILAEKAAQDTVWLKRQDIQQMEIGLAELKKNALLEEKLIQDLQAYYRLSPLIGK